jgi:hypothetical protein
MRSVIRPPDLAPRHSQAENARRSKGLNLPSRSPSGRPAIDSYRCNRLRSRAAARVTAQLATTHAANMPARAAFSTPPVSGRNMPTSSDTATTASTNKTAIRPIRTRVSISNDTAVRSQLPGPDLPSRCSAIQQRSTAAHGACSFKVREPPAVTMPAAPSPRSRDKAAARLVSVWSSRPSSSRRGRGRSRGDLAPRRNSAISGREQAWVDYSQRGPALLLL